jgi:hypothetical protein
MHSRVGSRVDLERFRVRSGVVHHELFHHLPHVPSMIFAWPFVEGEVINRVEIA